MNPTAEVPTTKLTATVTLYANSQDELSEAVRRLALNWEFHVAGRDEVNIIGGDRTIRIEHTNPEQTPEGYRADLEAWSAARKAKRERCEAQGCDGSGALPWPGEDGYETSVIPPAMTEETP